MQLVLSLAVVNLLAESEKDENESWRASSDYSASTTERGPSVHSIHRGRLGELPAAAQGVRTGRSSSPLTLSSSVDLFSCKNGVRGAVPGRGSLLTERGGLRVLPGGSPEDSKELGDVAAS